MSLIRSIWFTKLGQFFLAVVIHGKGGVTQSRKQKTNRLLQVQIMLGSLCRAKNYLSSPSVTESAPNP